MGNTLHQLRRGTKELKDSMRLSDAFQTVQQRKGDRFIKAFVGTFALSMAVNLYAHMLEHQVEADYMGYRRNVASSISAER